MVFPTYIAPLTASSNRATNSSVLLRQDDGFLSLCLEGLTFSNIPSSFSLHAPSFALIPAVRRARIAQPLSTPPRFAHQHPKRATEGAARRTDDVTSTVRAESSKQTPCDHSVAQRCTDYTSSLHGMSAQLKRFSPPMALGRDRNALGAKAAAHPHHVLAIATCSSLSAICVFTSPQRGDSQPSQLPAADVSDSRALAHQGSKDQTHPCRGAVEVNIVP